MDVVRTADAAAAAAAAADLLVSAARTGLQITLAGGSTPRAAYEAAARAEHDWSAAGFWWGDERCVPPDDERSNYRLAADALLDRVHTTPPSIHRIRGELGAEAAARAYEEELRPARLDLVLLGIGPDGHTASLFPKAPTLDETERLAVPAEPGLAPLVERVTLTRPALASAAHVVFLAVGEDKAEAVERAFAIPPDRRTPASLVRSREGRTTAILDRAAAARL